MIFTNKDYTYTFFFLQWYRLGWGGGENQQQKTL